MTTKFRKYTQKELFKIQSKGKKADLTFLVAGCRYAQANECLKDINIGDSLDLKQDVGNKYDRYAVAIFWKNQKTDKEFFIGYVPMTLSQRVATSLQKQKYPMHCFVSEVDSTGQRSKPIRAVIRGV
jgi:hypothetical protein